MLQPNIMEITFPLYDRKNENIYQFKILNCVVKNNVYFNDFRMYSWEHVTWKVQCGGITTNITSNELKKALLGNDRVFIDIGFFNQNNYDM